MVPLLYNKFLKVPTFLYSKRFFYISCLDNYFFL